MDLSGCESCLCMQECGMYLSVLLFMSSLLPSLPLSLSPQIRLITSKGYRAEAHYVTTTDGYILCLHRIPCPQNQPCAFLPQSHANHTKHARMVSFPSLLLPPSSPLFPLPSLPSSLLLPSSLFLLPFSSSPFPSFPHTPPLPSSTSTFFLPQATSLVQSSFSSMVSSVPSQTG